MVSGYEIIMMEAEHRAAVEEVEYLRWRGWGVSRTLTGDVFHDEFGDLIGTTTMGVPRTHYMKYLSRG